MDDKFIPLTHSMIRRKDLTMQEKIIYLEILNLSSLEKGCIASNNHFEKCFGISKKSVSNTISSLIKKGFIDSEISNRNHTRILSIKDGQPSIKDGQPSIKDGETKGIKQSNITNNIQDIVEIITHLNDVCKTEYKHTTKKTNPLIKARLEEGFTLEDFKKVHITKYAEWYGTDMQKYLRPETLYGTKFESYLNQAPTDYEKLNAITSHTGLTPLQLLKQQGFAE